MSLGSLALYYIVHGCAAVSTPIFPQRALIFETTAIRLPASKCKGMTNLGIDRYRY